VASKFASWIADRRDVLPAASRALGSPRVASGVSFSVLTVKVEGVSRRSRTSRPRGWVNRGREERDAGRF
jgi:hypothetical protein